MVRARGRGDGRLPRSLRLRLFRLADRNFQRADAVDAALDLVSWRERGDAGRRSRHDDVAGADLDLLRELPDDFRHAPDQLGQITLLPLGAVDRDRKSTRLNSSHVEISYAVFC